MAAPLSITSSVRLSSGHAMPVLGFGVYQNYNTTPCVLEALAAGYRHIDTAQAYRNEADVGAAVATSGLARADVFITTKVISSNHGTEKTLRAVAASLPKLGGYVDLFLIHNPHAGRALRLETYRALLARRDAGDIRSVGVSNYGVKHLEEIRAAGLEAPAVNQLELHPRCQQRPIAEYCAAHGIVVQAYAPLMRGRWDGVPALHEIADRHGKAVAQVLVRWSLQHGFVPLPKSATAARIHSNADVFDFALDEEDMARLDALDMGAEGAITWNPVDAD